MKPLSHALVVLLAVVPASAEDKAPEGDLARLQGTWKAMIGRDKDRPVTLEIKGDAVAVSFTSDQGEMHSVKATLKLDETATPKGMDWAAVTRDGEDVPEILAIYELTGDTLKIRAGRRPRDVRPTEFLPDTGTDDDQAILTRQKDESKEVKSSAARPIGADPFSLEPNR